MEHQVENNNTKPEPAEVVEVYRHPDKDIIIDMIAKLLRIVYPGYSRDKSYRIYNARHNLSMLIEDVMYNLNKQMALVEAEKKIAERARQNRQGHCGCVTPWEAEEILRDFYGLGGGVEELPAEEEDQRPAREGKILDLADFL